MEMTTMGTMMMMMIVIMEVVEMMKMIVVVANESDMHDLIVDNMQTRAQLTSVVTNLK